MVRAMAGSEVGSHLVLSAAGGVDRFVVARVAAGDMCDEVRARRRDMRWDSQRGAIKGSGA